MIWVFLPNSLHFKWALGSRIDKKNILIEKEFTSKSNRKVFYHKNFGHIFFSEGYMYKYHPQIAGSLLNL